MTRLQGSRASIGLVEDSIDKRFIDRFISLGNNYPVCPEELKSIKSSVAAHAACDIYNHMEGGKC